MKSMSRWFVFAVQHPSAHALDANIDNHNDKCISIDNKTISDKNVQSFNHITNI